MALLNNFGAHGPGVTWSLAVEEQFYLTLPPLVRFLSLRNLAFDLAGGILFAPIPRIILHAIAPSYMVSWYVLMPCRADALLLGVVGAVLLRDNIWKERLSRHRRIFLYLLVPLSIGVAVLKLRFFAAYSVVMLGVGYTWLALLSLHHFLCPPLPEELVRPVYALR
jgi:peptidoglycan/LPS O-acetylase OafA/YrhL